MYQNIKKFIKNKLGAGSVETAIKVLTAVVLGAAIMIGSYSLITGVVLPATKKNVSSLFNYSADYEGGSGGSGGVKKSQTTGYNHKAKALHPTGITFDENDTVEIGDYKYILIGSEGNYSGIKVEPIDECSTGYGPILESINGINITNMSGFLYCNHYIEETPVIPFYVNDLSFAFAYCENLTTPIKIEPYTVQLCLNNILNSHPSNEYEALQNGLQSVDFGSGLQESEMLCMKNNSVYLTFETYEYETNDYIYNYKYIQNKSCEVIGRYWEVSVKDKTKTSYEPIKDSIFNIPVKSLECTFMNCTNLVTAPVIPESVVDMHNTFSGCTSLVTAPVIPESVVDMHNTFSGCTSLVTAPIIPESAVNINNTFSGCTNLTGTIEVNCYFAADWTCFIYNCPNVTGITGSTINGNSYMLTKTDTGDCPQYENKIIKYNTPDEDALVIIFRY